LENNRTKFKPRARKGVFIRYKTGVKGYIVLDIKTRKIFINRHVTFYNHIFSYVNSEDKMGNRIKESEGNLNDVFYDYTHIDNNTPVTQTGSNLWVEDSSVHTSKQENLVNSTIETKSNSTYIRRYGRVRRIPNYLTDYHHQVNLSNFAHNNIEFKNALKTPYPISNVFSYHSLSKK